MNAILFFIADSFRLRQRRAYLKEHHPILYTNLIVEGTLFEDLVDVDKQCNERMEHLCTAMAKQEGVTEALKAADQMEWVRRMNNIKQRVTETVNNELIYK